MPKPKKYCAETFWWKIWFQDILVKNMVPKLSGEKYGAKTFQWKIPAPEVGKYGAWWGLSFSRLSCGPNNCAESFIIHDMCDCSSQKYSVIYVNEKHLCLGCMILQSNIQWIHSPAQLSWDSYYIVTLKEIIQFDIMGSQQLKLHVQNLSPPLLGIFS